MLLEHPQLSTGFAYLQEPGYYQVPGGTSIRQRNCTYATFDMLVPGSGASDAVFIPTRIQSVNETIAKDCRRQNSPRCGNWVEANTTEEFFVPDLRLFLITVNHAFTSSVGIGGSSSELNGEFLDQSSKPMDLCAPYTSLKLPCPSSVGLVQEGEPDIFPLGTLFTAAGISYLDLPGGGKQGGKKGIPKRLTGFAILVSIDYSNYYYDRATSKGTRDMDQNTYVFCETVCIVRQRACIFRCSSADSDTRTGSLFVSVQ